MIRRRPALLIFLFVCWNVWGQAPAPFSGLPPHVLTAFGTFERVPSGWRCRYISPSAPPLLRSMQHGDVLTSIDSQDLSTTSPIGMLQQLRMVEFGWAGSVEVDRAGRRLSWQADMALPQITASQRSLTVLRSTLDGIRPGDVLKALGQIPFSKAFPEVENPLAVVLNIDLESGQLLRISRDGQAKDIPLARAAVVHFLQFDLNPAQEVSADTQLRGLNTGDVTLQSLRGRWTLLNFWATWCVPCLRHLPEMRELAQVKDLNVAAIGFADTQDRLAVAAAREKALKVYAPHPPLQNQLAMSGIPFDVLLDPEGKAALVISGDMRDRFKTILMQYVDQ